MIGKIELSAAATVEAENLRINETAKRDRIANTFVGELRSPSSATAENAGTNCSNVNPKVRRLSQKASNKII